jgi:2-oxoglutarate/2-oxoacid ferredoxin oxidoreductase subunit beta
MIGEAALLSGLWASQSDDYPVTVKSGHSISELVLSPREILYAGIQEPDALVLVSEEGRRHAGPYLAGLRPESWLFVPREFAGLATPARKVVFDLDAAGTQARKKNAGLLMSAAAMRFLDLFPIEACAEALRGSQRSGILEENLEALAQSGLLQQALKEPA